MPRRFLGVISAAGALCALAAAGSANGAPPLGAPSADGSWRAEVLYPVIARKGPKSAARRLPGRVMHFTAFSRRPNVLMVTGVTPGTSGPSAPIGGGSGWVRVQLPRRPNGTQAWLPRAAVRLTRVRTRIVVRIRSRRVEVWRGERRIKSFPAVVGTGATPTPTGSFAVQDPVASSPAQRAYLGPYIVTLTAHSRVLKTFMGGDGLIGIHGTNAPGLLGTAASHGCVRLSNRAVTILRRFARPGVPVRVVAS